MLATPCLRSRYLQVNVQGERGMAPLHVAVWDGNTAAVASLLAAKVGGGATWYGPAKGLPDAETPHLTVGCVPQPVKHSVGNDTSLAAFPLLNQCAP